MRKHPVRVVRNRVIVGARQATRGVERAITAARLAPIRLGAPVGVVFGFHGVVAAVEDRDIQINHVDVGAFGRALDAIADRFEIVPLEALADALDGGRSSGRIAALTFDDGYRSTLEIADPILAERGLPYSVFVCPGLIDGAQRLPTFVVEAAIRFAPGDQVALPNVGTLDVSSESARRTAAADVVSRVKALQQPDVRVLVQACRTLLGSDDWRAVERRFESEALLSWDELRVLAAKGVGVGSHTTDHASLHEGQSADELRLQLVDSRRRLEEELGSVSSAFCYPYGRYGNLSRAGVAAVAAAGYRIGLTLETGTVRAGMSRLVLPRVYVGPKFDPQLLDRLLEPLRDRRFLHETTRLGLV